MTPNREVNASVRDQGIISSGIGAQYSPNPRSSEAARRPILITIDLEDWFQVENLRSVYPHNTWDLCDLRVKMNARILLDLLDHYNVRATFFVLGWIAERCPDLVREIHNRGHEIGCHGYDHRLCSDMTARDLRDDVQKSKSILADIISYPVIGYRAPSFSVTPRLIEILKELNFVYDSSYNNATLNKRYGKLPLDSWHRSTSGHLMYRNGVIELPILNLRAGRMILPWGGWRVSTRLAALPLRMGREKNHQAGRSLYILHAPLGDRLRPAKGGKASYSCEDTSLSAFIQCPSPREPSSLDIPVQPHFYELQTVRERLGAGAEGMRH